MTAVTETIEGKWDFQFLFLSEASYLEAWRHTEKERRERVGRKTVKIQRHEAKEYERGHGRCT